MKMFVGIGFTVMALLAVPVAFAAEKVVEVDASGGKAAGHWVIVISKAMAPNAPTGLAAIAVGNGDKFEGAYGFNMAGGKPTDSAVTEDAIKAARTSDKAPDASVLKIKVTAEQHAAVKKLIEKSSAIKELSDPPNDVAVNFAQDVIKELKMNRAYRLGLGAVNAVQYYADLAVVNRKFPKKTT